MGDDGLKTFLLHPKVNFRRDPLDITYFSPAVFLFAKVRRLKKPIATVSNSNQRKKKMQKVTRYIYVFRQLLPVSERRKRRETQVGP